LRILSAGLEVLVHRGGSVGCLSGIDIPVVLPWSIAIFSQGNMHLFPYGSKDQQRAKAARGRLPKEARHCDGCQNDLFGAGENHHTYAMDARSPRFASAPSRLTIIRGLGGIEMTEQVINFSVRKLAREKEIEAYHAQVDDFLLRHAIVAQAIKQMQEFSSDDDIHCFYWKP